MISPNASSAYLNKTGHKQRVQTRAGQAGWLWALLVFLGLVGFQTILSMRYDCVYNNDFIGFADRIHKLSQPSPDASLYANGLYPLGYPMLVLYLSKLVGSLQATARLISLASSASVLLCTYLLARRAAGLLPALVAMVLVGLGPLYTILAATEGTDLPALALTLAAVLITVPHLERGHRPFVPLSAYLVAGLLLGLAYLVRYTALASLPVLMLGQGAYLYQQRRRWAMAAGLLTIGFALGAWPQLLISAYVRGNPFYNTQYINVWFALHGHGYLQLAYAAAPKYAGIGDVVAHNLPIYGRLLVSNALRLVRESFDNPLIFSWVLLVPGACLLFFLRKLPQEARPRASLILFCIIVGLGMAAPICLAFVTGRIALVWLPFAAVALSLSLDYLLRACLPADGAWYGVISLSILLASGGWLAWRTNGAYAGNGLAYSQTLAALGSRLHQAGMQDSRQEVLALGYNLYDGTHPEIGQYDKPWQYDSIPYRSWDDILWQTMARRRRFMVYEWFSQGSVLGMSSFFTPKQLGPEWIPVPFGPGLGGVYVYKIHPDTAARFRPAHQEDWETFAATSHLKPDAALWDLDSASIQEMATRPATFSGIRADSLLPAWRAWKGRHRRL